MGSIFIQKSTAVTACLVLGAPLSWGQGDNLDQGIEEPLTADALVARVLEENAGLAAAQAAAQAAAYRIDPAGALDDPMLSYSVAPRSSDRTVDFSQRFPWPGTLSAREAVARHEAAAAESKVGAERLELAAAAKAAWAEWYFVARALALHHDAEDLVDELVASARTRYAAGIASRQDVLQAEVERADLEAQELQLLRQQTAAQARINALLNRAPDTPLPPAAPVAIDSPIPDGRVLERLALARHPELQRAEARIAAANSRVTLARKEFYPDFELHAGYNAMWNDPDQRPMIGISINIPFARSKREAELDSARAEVRRTERSRADMRAQLLADVARARARVVESLDTIQLYEERLVPLAREYFDAAITDYRSGSGAFLNVVTAERRSLVTRLALERARADYVRRLAELELATAGELRAATTGRRGEEQ